MFASEEKSFNVDGIGRYRGSNAPTSTCMRESYVVRISGS